MFPTNYKNDQQMSNKVRVKHQRDKNHERTTIPYKCRREDEEILPHWWDMLVPGRVPSILKCHGFLLPLLNCGDPNLLIDALPRNSCQHFVLTCIFA